jgi:hypothetical protein
MKTLKSYRPSTYAEFQRDIEAAPREAEMFLYRRNAKISRHEARTVTTASVLWDSNMSFLGFSYVQSCHTRVHELYFRRTIS